MAYVCEDRELSPIKCQWMCFEKVGGQLPIEVSDQMPLLQQNRFPVV